MLNVTLSLQLTLYYKRLMQPGQCDTRHPCAFTTYAYPHYTLYFYTRFIL